MFKQTQCSCRQRQRLSSLLLCAMLLFFFQPAVAASAPAEGRVPTLSDEALLSLVTDAYIQETQAIFFDFDSLLPVERINNCVEAWKARTFGYLKEDVKKSGITNEDCIEFGAKVLYAFDNQRQN